jgi:hypothetical protein
MSPEVSAGTPSFISPHYVYPIAGFCSVSGIKYDRIQRAKKDGIPFPGFKIGKRLFIKGSSALEYLDRLAAHSAKQEEQQ